MTLNSNNESPILGDKDASGVRWLVTPGNLVQESNSKESEIVDKENIEDSHNKELLSKIDELQSQVHHISNKLDKSKVRPKILTPENIEKTSETVVAGFGLTIVGIGIIGFVVFFVMAILGMILY